MSKPNTLEPEKMAKLGTTASSWVPNLYYDLIARVVPGFVVSASVLTVVAGPERTWTRMHELVFVQPPPSIALLLLAGIPFTYTLSIVLYGLGRAIRNHLPGAEDRATWDDELSIKFDFVKCHRPSTGHEAGKLRAEMHMVGVLRVGWTLCLLLGLARLDGALTRADSGVFLVLVLCILSTFSTRSHLDQCLKKKIENYARLLGYEEPAVESASTEPQAANSANPPSKNAP